MAKRKTRVKVTRSEPRRFMVVNPGKVVTSEDKRFRHGEKMLEHKDVNEHDANILLKGGDIEEVAG